MAAGTRCCLKWSGCSSVFAWRVFLLAALYFLHFNDNHSELPLLSKVNICGLVERFLVFAWGKIELAFYQFGRWIEPYLVSQLGLLSVRGGFYLLLTTWNSTCKVWNSLKIVTSPLITKQCQSNQLFCLSSGNWREISITGMLEQKTTKTGNDSLSTLISLFDRKGVTFPTLINYMLNQLRPFTGHYGKLADLFGLWFPDWTLVTEFPQKLLTSLLKLNTSSKKNLKMESCFQQTSPETGSPDCCANICSLSSTAQLPDGWMHFLDLLQGNLQISLALNVFFVSVCQLLSDKQHR